MNKRHLLVLIGVLLAGTISAQTFRGAIEGTVTDATGAAVTTAEVTASNSETGLTRTVSSDDEGNYSISELPLGTYSVSATKTGFRRATVTAVSVAVAAHARVNIQLQPGQVQETVEVRAEVPLIETTVNNLGGTIQAEQATELPINGRDFTKVLVMVPGATGDPSGATDSPGSFGLFSINGNRGRSNNYLLDGTDMNDGYRNLPAINEAGVFGTPATVLPVDAVAEFSILNSVEPEFGRNAGATVNIVTKSGTNTLHGSVYEFFRNNWLDARNYFNTTDLPQNQFHNNQFGGSVGGPIVRDSTFFFAAYEGQRESGSLTSLATVPSEAQIASYGGASNPVIANLLALEPWGTLPATGENCGELEIVPACAADIQRPIPFRNRVDSLIFKLDQHIGKDLLTGRYFFGDSDQLFPLALQIGGSAGALPGFNTVTPTTVHVLSLSYTHIFTPRFLMEVRGGYNRFDESFLPEDNAFDPNSIGLATVSDPQDFGLPLIRVSGLSPLGANASTPRGRVDTNTHLLSNVSYTTGAHNWKFGYEFRRTAVDQFFDAGYRGLLAFSGMQPFLEGTVDSFSRQARGDSRRNTLQNNHSFYFQDNWRLTPRLSLNYGLRWDYYGVISEAQDRFSIFDPSVPDGGLQQVSQLYPKDLNNFAPRISFAWDIFGTAKTVLRAGWGVYYDAFSQDFFIGQLPFNTFNPGPAYNNIGSSPVQFAFIFGGDNPVLAPGVNVFDPDPASGATFYCPDYFACDAFTVDQNLRTPYIQNYNVNVEQQVGPNAAVQIGYVGSQGRKLFRYRDINQGFLLANLGYVNQFESSASSSYNALQTTLKIRSWRGFTSQVNYTWSHSLDNASDGQDYVAQATQPDDSFHPERERGNSNFDTRHRFQWYWTYGLPQVQTWKTLLNGWAINGVVTLQSGQPYNVTYLFEGDFNGSGEFFGRPDLVGDPFAGTGGLNILNLSAFAAPCDFDQLLGDCAGGRHFGNLGRNAFTGTPYRNFDFSLVKNTPLTERLNMQIRADFFNILNHPNFSNPLLPNFGITFLQNGGEFVDTADPADDPNVGQLRGSGFLAPTVTPDVGIGNPFLGGGGPRNIQLAVRFTF